MTPADIRRWKRLAVRPFLLVVLSVLVLNAAAWGVDGSTLRREEGSWGYALAAFFLGIYAVPVLAVSAVCALLALATESRRDLAVCAWVAAGASALAGTVLGALVVPTLVGSPAGLVFGLAALGVAAALLSPLVTCVRRTRAGSDR